LDFKRVVFSGHAVRRMFEWGIRRDEVLEVLRDGEVITEYPEDKPFPSCLVLGLTARHALHVVAALDHEIETCHIITAYPPDPVRWQEDFKTRRRP